jgi:small subunit ribosomal protein S7
MYIIFGIEKRRKTQKRFSIMEENKDIVEEISEIQAESVQSASEMQANPEEIPLEKPKVKKARKPKAEKVKELKPLPNYRANIKLFGRWPTNVEVRDAGLKPYLNLNAVYVPYSAGRAIKKQFWKSKKSIVERLALKLMVTGHKGKKHFWTSNVNTGKSSTQFRVIRDAFEIIEKKTGKNPLEVLIKAIESGSPREGIATIEYGGVRYPKAADLAPQRRVDLVLRWIIQGAFLASLKGKNHIQDTLANEIIATAAGDAKATAMSKRTDLERQAAASR